MGHSLAFITIDTDRAEQIRKELPSQRSAWGYRPTFESEMVTAAVRKWQDEEANRWDSANPGRGVLTPIMADSHLNGYIEDNWELARDSLVVPIARAEDVIEKTVKVKVPVDAAELAQARAALAASRDGRGLIPHEMWGKIRGIVQDPIASAAIIAVPAARKPVAVATEGAAKTVYEVVAVRHGRRDVYAQKPTQAEARTEAIRIMEADARITDLAVQARVVRDSDAGADLVRISRPAAPNATITIEVVTHTLKATAKPAHYVVTFDYHH